jgi:hypothetical protein
MSKIEIENPPLVCDVILTKETQEPPTIVQKLIIDKLIENYRKHLNVISRNKISRTH